MYINKTTSLTSDERRSICDIVFHETFVGASSIDRDEHVRMQLFSILSKEVLRKKTTIGNIWNYLLSFLKTNFLGQSNKFRQHLLTNFKPIMNIIMRDMDIIGSDAQTFVKDFTKYLLSNIYPGVSSQKRSSVLCFLKIILESIDRKIFDIVPISNDQFKVTVKTLLYFFSDSFEENRNNASDCFVIFVNSKDGFTDFDVLMKIALEKSSSSNPTDSVLSFTMLRTLLRCNSAGLSAQILVENLVTELEADLRATKSTMDLVTMAVQKPFYSSLFCLRQILHENFLPMPCIDLLKRILGLCYTVSEIIFPVIASAAPEGCLPSDLGDFEEMATLRSNPEYLTLCCWRSCKEISLILGHVSVKGVQGLYDYLIQVDEIAEFFFFQITSVTHKGAFETLSLGFEPLCRALWKSPIQGQSTLPLKLLERALDIIENNATLCLTRRSAGLPHLFHLLITSQPLVNKSRTSLAITMHRFIAILSSADPNCASDQKRIIHILNILRFLFKESCLSTQMIDHTFFSVQYSVQFFSSNVWPLRNAATLLFCAIIERVFGPTKCTTSSYKYSRLNSKVFFNRYPQMYDFISDILCQNLLVPVLGLDQSVKVYPILILLGRLIPEANDFLDSMYPIDFLRTSSISYLSSPVWIIRVAAARAVALLSLKEDSGISSIRYLIQEIMSKMKSSDLNFVHGAIKTIRYMVEDFLDDLFLSETLQKSLSDVIIYLWTSLAQIISVIDEQTQCPLEFIEIFQILSKKAPFLLRNVDFSSVQINISSVWLVKLLIIIAKQSETDLEDIKSWIMKAVSSENYLIRQEMMTELSESRHLVQRFFVEEDVLRLLELWQCEKMEGVELGWVNLVRSLCLHVYHLGPVTVDLMIEVVRKRLIKDGLEMRRESWCHLLELMGVVLSRVGDNVRGEVSEECLRMVKNGSRYHNDVEVREASARTFLRVVSGLGDIGLSNDVMETLVIQLHDESASVRNLAADCYLKVYAKNRLSCGSVLPSIVSSNYIREDFSTDSLKYRGILKKDKLLGYTESESSSTGRMSVFESEEVNTYYDFVEVYSCVGADPWNGSGFVLEYDTSSIIRDSTSFAVSFKDVVLDL